MHSSGESYSSHRLAARRFEQQHRLFKDLNLQSRKVVAGLNPATPNMEKVKCCKCGKAGHISVNCRVKTGDKDVSKSSSTRKGGSTGVAPATSKKGVRQRCWEIGRKERKNVCDGR